MVSLLIPLATGTKLISSYTCAFHDRTLLTGTFLLSLMFPRRRKRTRDLLVDAVLAGGLSLPFPPPSLDNLWTVVASIPSSSLPLITSPINPASATPPLSTPTTTIKSFISPINKLRMDPFSSLILSLVMSIALLVETTSATTFTFTNKCGDTVWPGILSNAGNPPSETTGFELQSGSSHSFQAPSGWSGRFWARTGCKFDSSGRGSCSTGDCGSGEMQCNGAGAAPPATLAEFSLAGPTSGKDFYDVSLVDGYNLPMVVESSGAGCPTTGCVTDLNQVCPAELRVGAGDACRSACEAFGKPEYCCSGAFSSPATCRPSVYSQMFKNSCPRSYSYAYDDPTSTFTCSGPADYTITFCPDSSPSKKSATATATTPNPKTTAGEGVALENDSWLASLAMGSSGASEKVQLESLLAISMACILLFL